MQLTSTLVAIAAGLLAASPAQATPTTDLHHAPVKTALFFGDSYTDDCNRWRSQNPSEAQKYPFPACPPPPTGRASGGRSWVEYINRIPHTVNLAVSGATCNNSATDRSPLLDVGQQIDYARTKQNTTAPTQLSKLYDSRTTMATIYISTNDLAYFLSDLVEANPILLQSDMGKARKGNFLEVPDCILSRLETLHAQGVRRFVLMENVPLQGMPQYGNTVGSRTFVETMVLTNNRIQSLQVGNLLNKWHDGSRIDIFPTYDFFQSIFAHPAAYGFSRMPQYDPQNDYLANDLHPSDRANEILAKKFERFVLDGARGPSLINGTS